MSDATDEGGGWLDLPGLFSAGALAGGALYYLIGQNRGEDKLQHVDGSHGGDSATAQPEGETYHLSWTHESTEWKRTEWDQRRNLGAVAWSQLEPFKFVVGR